jgi:hypothetical protein
MTDIDRDALRWCKKLHNKQIKPNPYSKDKTGYNAESLENLRNEILADNDWALAYFFLTEFDYKPHRMSKIIIDSNDPKYICYLACFVEKSYNQQLERIVIASQNPKYAHLLLKYVKNCDAQQLKPIIVDSKKPRYLFELAKHLTLLQDISEIEDLIIKSGSHTYMRLFARKIKLANIDKIEQAVLDSNNTEEIKKFAVQVKKSRIRQFLIL